MKLNTYIQSVVCLAFLCLPAAHAVSQTASAITQNRAADAYGKLPLSFEANQGQSDSQVKFLTRDGLRSVSVETLRECFTALEADQK